MNHPQKVRAYHSRLKAEKADDIYARLVTLLTRGKRYRHPDCSATKLAEELGTNKRYISAAIAVATGGNFRSLLNGLRLRDACKMMTLESFRDTSVEEIGLLAGFASRQAFYIAFSRVHDCTPLAYRKKYGKTPSDH